MTQNKTTLALALMLVFNYFIHLSARLEEVTLAANQILIGFLGLVLDTGWVPRM